MEVRKDILCYYQESVEEEEEEEDQEKLGYRTF